MSIEWTYTDDYHAHISSDLLHNFLQIFFGYRADIYERLPIYKSDSNNEYGADVYEMMIEPTYDLLQCVAVCCSVLQCVAVCSSYHIK